MLNNFRNSYKGWGEGGSLFSILTASDGLYRILLPSPSAFIEKTPQRLFRTHFPAFLYITDTAPSPSRGSSTFPFSVTDFPSARTVILIAKMPDSQPNAPQV